MAEKTNQQKLDDIWWILCADDGRPALMDMIAQAVTHKDIPWFGFDGKQPTDGRTTVTLADIAAWSDTAWAGMNQKLATMQELVRQLSVAQGVTIDYAAIAKAVNDDAAARMKG